MLNIALFEKVKAHILEEPRRLAMGSWAKKFDLKKIELESTSFGQNLVELLPPCGTTGCIAGWAIMLEKQVPADDLCFLTADIKAAGLLGLTKDQSERLFFTNEWPADYSNAYRVARDAEERARVTIQRIDYFIRTNGNDYETADLHHS